MADEKLDPQRAVRLLRAKAGELEARVLEVLAEYPNDRIGHLQADIALIAGLLADHMEYRWAHEMGAASASHITPEIVHDPWGKEVDPERVRREEKRERDNG